MLHQVIISSYPLHMWVASKTVWSLVNTCQPEPFRVEYRIHYKAPLFLHTISMPTVYLLSFLSSSHCTKCSNGQYTSQNMTLWWDKRDKPVIKQVQALTDISCSVLRCHSNETCALIANLPNSVQLGGTPYHSPKLRPGPCSSVGILRGIGRHTDGRDQYTFRLGYASHEM